MPDHPLDYETMRSAVKDGERRALALVGARILRVVGGELRGKPREIIEDAVADATRKYVGAFARFDPLRDGSIDAWLHTIALNVARDYLRRSRVQSRVIRDSEYTPDEDSSTAGAESEAWRDARRVESILMLKEAFAQIDEGDRRIVILRYWEGLTVKETAVELGIPEGTVHSASFRAAERMRKHIDERTSRTGYLKRRSGT